MGLIEAIPFLKGAVGRSSGNPIYGFHEGVIYARSVDHSILASYPIPHILGTFALAANELESIISRFKTEPEIASGDSTIILKSGRQRPSLDLLSFEPPGDISKFDSNLWEDLPEDFITALQTGKPFIAVEGQWQRSLLLDQNRIMALSSRSAIEIRFSFKMEFQLSIPSDCVDYLVGIKEKPEQWVKTSTMLLFSWASGAKVKCQTLALSWPQPYNSSEFMDQFEKKIEGDPIKIDEEYRTAFLDAGAIASLSDGTVTIQADKIIGKADHATQEIDLETGSKTETKWNLKTLIPVLSVADEWFPDSEGASFFRAENIRGIVVKRR